MWYFTRKFSHKSYRLCYSLLKSKEAVTIKVLSVLSILQHGMASRPDDNNLSIIAWSGFSSSAMIIEESLYSKYVVKKFYTRALISRRCISFHFTLYERIMK